MKEVWDSTDFADLKARIRTFNRYEKVFDFLTELWIIPFFLSLLMSSFWRPSKEPLTNPETSISILAVFSVWISVAFIVGRKLKDIGLKDDEWATFYSISIIENLAKYKKYKESENLGMQKRHRKKAYENAKDFLSCIEKRWKIGRFKLAKDIFEQPLLEFKKNIRYRVIPALKDGDHESLVKVEHIMIMFNYLEGLSLETINTVNKTAISVNLPTTEGREAGFLNRLSNYLRTHKVAKDGLFVSLLIAGCCVFYYLLVTYVGIIKEYAITVGVAVFIGLLTIYYRRQQKE